MPDHDPPAAVRTPSGAPPASGSLPGETPPFPVPDHTLIRCVGRGAYGEVWLARNTLGTWRAVKFIRRSSFDDDRPFERELAGIQRFEPISRSHESQLNILHVGRAEDGFYYVMELADDMGRGQDIDEATYTPRNLRSELLLRGRLPAAECLRLGLALTTALEHLHKHSLVHRDIKPSNIVFVNGIPKLADIGLVARAEATISFVGTEGFLPPEGPGTRQADIYSLGKVLYELSTGHDRQQFPELPTNIVELPDRAELSELNEVLLKACHRDPKDRYQTAAEMHVDLALLESGRSIVRMRGLERRLRFVQRAGAVVTVIAALAAGLYLWQARQTRIVRDLAAEKDKLAGENRERIVRLDIANGVRLLDANDPSAALLWFADALPLVTNNPAVADIHRIRIQQTLDYATRLLSVMADAGFVFSGAFGPDNRQIAMTTGRPREGTFLTLKNSQSGVLLWAITNKYQAFGQARFARDGQRLFVSSALNTGAIDRTPLPPELQLAEVRNTQTGKLLFPSIHANLLSSAFSPDDRWLAVALTNHVVQLLDANEGKLVAEMKGHTNCVNALAFSADGRRLVSANCDQTAQVWQLPSGEPAGKSLIHDLPVQFVALSADGAYLATAAATNSSEAPPLIQVWDVRTGKKIGSTITEKNETRALFFGPAGRQLLFTAGAAETLRVWNVDAGVTLQRTLSLPNTRCWSFSPDGRMLAIGTDGGFVSVWSTETWELLFPPLRHTGWVESVDFSSDGRQLLTTSNDGTAKVWSLSLETEAARLALPAKHPNEPAHRQRARGRTPGPIPMVLMDGWLHLVDPDGLIEVQTLKPLQTNEHMIGYSTGSTGRFWAVASTATEERSTKIITLWTCRDGIFRSLALSHPTNVIQMAFNADDSLFGTIAADKVVRFWRTSDGSIQKITQLPNSVSGVDGMFLPRPFGPDCQSMLQSLGAKDGRLQLFDLNTGQPAGKPFPDFTPFSRKRAQLSPDGFRLAIVSEDQFGRIVDLKTGELMVPPFKHGGDLYDLDWSPDGRRLITAGASSEVKLWDASIGEMLLSPMASTPSPTAMARSARWSADGRFIATRSDDDRARVWDASTTEPVTPFFQHSGYIRWVCITAGNRLITASDPNLLRAWDLKPTALPVDVIADYARFLSGRKLSASGALLPLKAEELEELNRSLRARAPQLFE